MKKIYKNILCIACMGSFFIGCSSKSTSSFTSLDTLRLPVKNYETKKNTGRSLSFATINPVLTINFNASTDLHNSLEKRLKHSANLLSCKLPTEIKKILISKGISVTDNYWSRNDMTFSQKRDTSTLFYPMIKIYVDQDTVDTFKSINDSKPKKSKTSGKLKVRATVELISLEPLSGEKIWLKSLPLKRKDFTVDIEYSGKLRRAKNIFSVDSRAIGVTKEIDNLIVEIYKKIIEGVEKYVDYDEFTLLNKDIAKIKKIKRY